MPQPTVLPQVKLDFGPKQGAGYQAYKWSSALSQQDSTVAGRFLQGRLCASPNTAPARSLPVSLWGTGMKIHQSEPGKKNLLTYKHHVPLLKYLKLQNPNNQVFWP